MKLWILSRINKPVNRQLEEVAEEVKAEEAIILDVVMIVEVEGVVVVVAAEVEVVVAVEQTRPRAKKGETHMSTRYVEAYSQIRVAGRVYADRFSMHVVQSKGDNERLLDGPAYATADTRYSITT
jgi:hypothetical protein